MKKVLILVAIVLICASSMVNAQDLKGMFNISPWAGLGIPMGDFGSTDVENDNAAFRKMGFKFGADAEYFFTSNIGLGVDFMYAIFSSDYPSEAEDYKDKVNSMNFGVHGKYVFMPENMLRPYVKAGVGMTMNKQKPDTGDEAKIDSKLFINGGFGAMYWVSEMISVFGEAGFDYLMVDNAKVKINDEEVGELTTNYYFIDFKVGLNVWFGGSE